jgi:hypothetical protein
VPNHNRNQVRRSPSFGLGNTPAPVKKMAALKHLLMKKALLSARWQGGIKKSLPPPGLCAACDTFR